MQLIANGTQLSSAMPAKRALSGTPGYANNIPGSGIATVVDADVLNTWLAEIINVILAAGIALDAGNNAQLLAAIRSLVSSGGVNPEWTAGNVSSVSGGVVSGGALIIRDFFKPYFASTTNTSLGATASISFTPTQNGHVFINGNGGLAAGVVTSAGLVVSGASSANTVTNFGSGSVVIYTGDCAVTAGTPVTISFNITSSATGVVLVGGSALFLPTA
jgi:hypothetical protein